MKRILSAIFIVALLAMSAACQPTPDREAVVNKGDKKTENAMLHPEAEEVVPLACPAHWTETMEIHEKMRLLIDAPVEVGEGNKHPVYAITRRAVDGESLLQSMQGIFPDTEALRQEVLSYDEILEDLQRYEGIESITEPLKERLAETPVESTFLDLTPENLRMENNRFDGAARRGDGSLAYYVAHNGESSSWIWYHSYRECGIERENWVMQLQQEEAEQAAQVVFQCMGQSNIQLSTATRAQCKDLGKVVSTGWLLEYGRATEGTRGCSLHVQSNLFFSIEEAFSMPWTPEYFRCM